MQLTHDTYRRLGARLTYNCTPYLELNIPRQGEIVAFSESSATPFVNSVWGARTNRESSQSALCSAVTGRTPLYGLLLDENRHGEVVVDVQAELRDEFDYHLLGYVVPGKIGPQTPVFTGIPRTVSPEALMNLGAQLNTAGAVSMYHIVGVTPEAPTLEAALGGRAALFPRDRRRRRPEEAARGALGAGGPDRLRDARLSASHGPPDRATSRGRSRASTLRAELWICTSFATREILERMGLLASIEAAGGHVCADTCIDQPCWHHLSGKRGMTDSPKCLYYASMRGMTLRPGPDQRMCRRRRSRDGRHERRRRTLRVPGHRARPSLEGTVLRSSDGICFYLVEPDVGRDDREGTPAQRQVRRRHGPRLPHGEGELGRAARRPVSARQARGGASGYGRRRARTPCSWLAP